MAGAARFGLAVRNLDDLTRTFNHADTMYKRLYKGKLRSIAEPTRIGSERLAVSGIRKIGPNWSRMRTGVTQKFVYVAPKQRGVKSRANDRLRRPNLARLLATRALEPALEGHRHQIESDFDGLLDDLVTEMDRDGP